MTDPANHKYDTSEYIEMGTFASDSRAKEKVTESD